MNKKIVSLIAALLVVLFALTACQSKPADNNATTVDPVTAVSAIVDGFYAANSENLPASMPLDDDMMRDFYGMNPEWLTAYVCNVPMMNVHATEIFVAHVKDGQMENVKAALDARKASLDATWSMYLPAQYELVQNSITVEQNGFILFAVTEYTDSIKNIFEQKTK